MRKHVILGSSLALAFAVSVSAQTTGSTASDSPTTTGAATHSTSGRGTATTSADKGTQGTVIVTGCVAREKDLRAKGWAGANIGMGDEFVLTNAMRGSGSMGLGATTSGAYGSTAGATTGVGATMTARRLEVRQGVLRRHSFQFRRRSPLIRR